MASSSPSRALQLPLEPALQLPEQTRKPSLLPAFEPLSSSPFPRPQSSKRKFNQDSPTQPKQLARSYPTPVPTSSTGFLTSSSPQKGRPALERSFSALSERQPLGTVPTVELPANGEVVRMGRSSNSSDYQLSANRLISRVHVEARYFCPEPDYPQGYIQIDCMGWNGAKIHCLGQVQHLSKLDSYLAYDPEVEIMLDVQDTRVIIAWPRVIPDTMWYPSDGFTPTSRRSHEHVASSPPIIPRSPVSQSPIRQPIFTASSAQPHAPGPVQIFEDEDTREHDGSSTPTPTSPAAADETFIRPSQEHSSPAQKEEKEALDTKASIQSSFNDDGFSDGDEENDPIVHSFGPFGENLNSRMASFSTATPLQPLRRRSVLTSPSPRKTQEPKRFKESPIKNHVINQLAYSRIHSQTISAIHKNLPSDLKACLKSVNKDGEDAEATLGSQTLRKHELKRMMDEVACIGEIPRSGKDAAGEPLENEFYYVPEMDTDMLRRETVTSGMRGAGLRSVRKQHKVSSTPDPSSTLANATQQYYWKKPRI